MLSGAQCSKQIECNSIKWNLVIHEHHTADSPVKTMNNNSEKGVMVQKSNHVKGVMR